MKQISQKDWQEYLALLALRGGLRSMIESNERGVTSDEQLAQSFKDLSEGHNNIIKELEQTYG